MKYTEPPLTIRKLNAFDALSLRDFYDEIDPFQVPFDKVSLRKTIIGTNDALQTRTILERIDKSKEGISLGFVALKGEKMLGVSWIDSSIRHKENDTRGRFNAVLHGLINTEENELKTISGALATMTYSESQRIAIDKNLIGTIDLSQPTHNFIFSEMTKKTLRACYDQHVAILL